MVKRPLTPNHKHAEINEKGELIRTYSVVYQEPRAKKAETTERLRFLSYMRAFYPCTAEKHDRAHWCLCEYISCVPDTFAYTIPPSACT